MTKPSTLAYIVEHADALQKAGVTAIDVGEGASRVRVEFAPLQSGGTSATVTGSALGEALRTGALDRERAGSTIAHDGSPVEEQGASDLDLAHLDDAD
jgi:hypothetical protein